MPDILHFIFLSARYFCVPEDISELLSGILGNNLILSGLLRFVKWGGSSSQPWAQFSSY